MKNFSAILIVLAASASLVAALPAPGAETHGIEARAPMFYAQHIHEARDRQRGQGGVGNGGLAGNGTFPANGTVATNPGNNGTADGNGKGRGHGNGRGKKGKGQDNGRGNGNNGNGNDNGLLDALLTLLGAAANEKEQGQRADGAAAGNDPLAILEGLLNNAAA